MKPEEIKERIELIDVFFAKDEISNESLTQNYCTEMTDDEEFLTSFFIEAFDFCGCGCLSMSIKFVRDILNCYEDEEGWGAPHLILDKAKEVCGNDNITDFVLHWLDTVELTEHGSSVYGSWLTDKGKALRGYLKKVVWEEEE
jgi:hypothetical protein